MNNEKKIDSVPITPEFLKSVEKEYKQSRIINTDLHEKSKTVKISNPEFNIKENQRIENQIIKNIDSIRSKAKKNDTINETSKKPN